MAAVTVFTAIGLAVDDRTLTGAPIWAKPLKFSLSFTAYGLSLSWMLSLLTRARRAGWWAGTVVAAAGAVEMIAIVGQAIRGKRSHFNHETPFDSAVFDLMAVTVVVLWSGALVIAILLFRARIADRASAWAIRLGALIALVGAALGFLMTRPTAEQQAAGGRGGSPTVGAHSVGVPDGGPQMPFTGWSATGGDLRIPHFFGMHALQLLPFLLLALTLLAPRIARLRDERVRLRLVLAGAAAYAAVLALVTWQALRGQPLLHPDGATLTAAAVTLTVCAIGVIAALRTCPAPPAPSPKDPTAKELAA
ncbi:hypothetical protein QCN29_28360 [Streptomyces sp. HNM0663]|uniref:Uncharacterized protein n=1 Tax=Streptomyces chengmaiensis TaxID=3040919 RepID=A0ABT6HV96_9ACTN|nr:hypothetical protein [Streptomyces chengmaiensis]MDH2392622.1 hypothetical protein [Streptomyces chengmaiensis]